MKLYYKLALLFFFCDLVSSAQVTILVNKGHFATVQQAAAGEDKVIFTDLDLADDRACTESFAAMELAKFLPKATNIKPEDIKYADPETMPKVGMVFLVGSRNSNPIIKKYGLPGGFKFDSEQAYSIRSFNDNGRIITIIEGYERIGTLYGVYHYLEEIGVKFIGLGEKGTVYPDSPLELPADLNININPSFLTRGFFTWGDRKVGEDFFFWLARNKFNYWTPEFQPVKLLKKLGVKLMDGGHSIQGRIFVADDDYTYDHPVFKGDENKPDDPYKVGENYQGDSNNDKKLSNFEAHPEWYGMKDGKRVKINSNLRFAQTGTNFCTSNEDARKEFAKRIVQSLIDGGWKDVDIFNLSTYDGGANQWCTCDECNKDMSYTNKLFLVMYDILNEVEKARQGKRLNRRVEICNSAYAATMEPPTKPLPADYDYKNSFLVFSPIGRCYAHGFADPACTEINQWQYKAFQGWTNGEERYFKGSVMIGEYYNIAVIKSLPLLFTKIMAVDIPKYHRSGALSFRYMHTLDTLWGTWTLNQHLLGKLLWNVNEDAGAVVNDYFRLYYPTTTRTTQKFYEQLEIASANGKLIRHRGGMENDQSYFVARRLLEGNLFELDHMHYEEYHPLVNDGPDVVEMIDAMELAKKHLEQSLIDCKNPVELQRLLEDAKRFEYGNASYRFIFHMIRTAIFHQKSDKGMAEREFAIVERYADQLRNMIDVVQSSSEHADSPNGFEAITGYMEPFNEFKKLYGK